MGREKDQFSSLTPDEPVAILERLDRFSPGLHPLTTGGLLADLLIREHVAEQLGLIELASNFVKLRAEYISLGIRRLCELYPKEEIYIRTIVAKRAQEGYIVVDKKVKQWIVNKHLVSLPLLYKELDA